jgi:hypothetical protein
MTKTYEDLFNLMGSINNVITAQTTDKDKTPSTKSVKKLVKIYERVKPLLDRYNEEVENLRLDNASVDEKDNLILGEKGDYNFSKEGLKTLISQKRDLLQKEIEFKVIEVVNPQGLENYLFLSKWVTGVTFNSEEDEEL